MQPMDSLTESVWDLVISGTGLQQSLLALALSRSGKKILHIDPNDYYGGAEASLSLQEADQWAAALVSSTSPSSVFRSAEITRPPESSRLSFPRAYSLALAPQIIHARSKLLSRLVSSRAYRQVEFMAVGSFFVLQRVSSETNDENADPPRHTLARVPSTREDVFSTTAIGSKAKRSLMKFLKFVVDHESPAQKALWEPMAKSSLNEFLQNNFTLDKDSQAYILALTLSLDGNITTRDGLAMIHRHISSMGVLGPGFAAVYPKWGGLSEVAQVSCRSCAVGGGVYMLGTGIREMRYSAEGLELDLTNDVSVKTKLLVWEDVDAEGESSPTISKLIVVVDSPLQSLFQPSVEGSPTPAVAMLVFPPGSVSTNAGEAYDRPVHVSAHSSDTGECPSDQAVLYLSTASGPGVKEILREALRSLLAAVETESKASSVLYELYYEQSGTSTASHQDERVLTVLPSSHGLSFDDGDLEPVQQLWSRIMAESPETEYMVFTDREEVEDDDEVYDC